MDNNKKLFEGLLKADGINPTSVTESERTAFRKMLDEQSKPKHSKPGITQPDIWRIIMKSKMIKLAATAVIIIALYIGLQVPSGLVSTAYALQDTIEANNSIRWLHIYESETIFQETRTSEIWLGCDEQGNVTRMRFQSDNVGEPVGSLTITGNSEKSEAWLSKHNLRMVGCGDPSVLLRYDVSELDPKFLFQKLFEQESRNEAIINVNEPMEKRKPIIVTVTYPQGHRSENWKKVFYIDQATKLVTRIDKFERRDQEFQHVKTLEFFDYNQQIDQMMFTLDSEVPTDAKVIDMTEVEAVSWQDDMTEEEIATEVTREFFEAIIAKDFFKAGQLYLRAPDFLVEQAFMGANVLKIISVGPAYPDPDPDSNAMISSCKVLAEIGGQYYEINAWMVRIIRADRDKNRWLICGTASSTNPASGDITFSPDGAELLNGPRVHIFADGSQVKLTENARIRLNGRTDKRGFEHIAGEAEVVVKKGDKEFVITSEFGTIKALGTAFKMDIFRVDSTNLLAVNVEEGAVEVSNSKGSKIIRENQRLTVEKDKAPYDFRQDDNLPPRLIERIQAMLESLEKGDKSAWLANFNINAFYDLAKGKVEHEQHPDWFSGMTPDDANRFRQAFANVNSPEEIKEIMLADMSDDIYKLYVRSVTLDKDGKHAVAVCVKKLKQVVGFTPQWTFFDGDWWQTDD